tara:strand:- start:3019 stop:3489 length:471 start_codon:yes stop_codon:yes gene_type:complete
MRSIWVTFRKEGIHKYPGADTDPRYATGDWDDVSFLGYPHRHKFYFKVWIEVFHNDRDIEFIQFQRWLERRYTSVEKGLDGDVLQLDYKSCEMIADDLATVIQNKYPGRWLKISVAEDDENGCEIEYPVNYMPGEDNGPNFDIPEEDIKDVFDSLK